VKFGIGDFYKHLSVNFHERSTNVLILFMGYYVCYLFLHVSASSMPSSRSLHVPTEVLVPSDSLFIKFCTMDGGGF
jgi:hypothetical protein